MRSSRLRADPLDPGRQGFAHRGLHRWPEIPENTLTAFAAALELGAGIECDLRLTADHRIAVYHDADGKRLSGRDDRLIDCTSADLSQWDVAGKPVPLIEQLLWLVDGRVPLLLEAKVEGSELWNMLAALRHAVANYRGRFGIMSFDPRVSRWLKTNEPGWQRGLVIQDALPPMKRWAALRLADPTFASVQVAALGKPWVAKLRKRMPIHSWTSRTRDDADKVRAFADAAIWEADGRP
nr:glycerophosphodiester phosphodiesterase family protein [Sphingomonas jaspsi]